MTTIAPPPPAPATPPPPISPGGRTAFRLTLIAAAAVLVVGSLVSLGVVAWGVAILVRSTTPVPMALPMSAVFVGVGLSAVVGLFFGIYPAQRAARLDPIEALRAE